MLFSIADTRQQGKVNWQEFLAFETTLQKPDAEFDVSSNHFLAFLVAIFRAEESDDLPCERIGRLRVRGVR